MDIWHYGFTEMLNNAKDHSGGTMILVKVAKTAVTTNVMIADNGIGALLRYKFKWTHYHFLQT